MECCGKAVMFSHEIHQISREIRRISKDQLPGMVSPMFIQLLDLSTLYFDYPISHITIHNSCVH